MPEGVLLSRGDDDDVAVSPNQHSQDETRNAAIDAPSCEQQEVTKDVPVDLHANTPSAFHGLPSQVILR